MSQNSKFRIKGTNLGYDVVIVGIFFLILFWLMIKEQNSDKKNISIKSDNSATNKNQVPLIKEEINTYVKPNNSGSKIETTKKCLINYDWTYPSRENPVSAWKFISDGTFNFSTKMFGGMTAWGNWIIENTGSIRVTYTRSTEGSIPSNQTLQLLDCNSLEVGTTIYQKD